VAEKEGLFAAKLFSKDQLMIPQLGNR